MATDRSGARHFGSNRLDGRGGQQTRGAEIDLASLRRELADLRASQPRVGNGGAAAKPWWLPRSGR